MSPCHFQKLSIRAVLALLLLATVPAIAQTMGQTSSERVLDRADLLPYLETIRRQYPRLYERLRREVPPEQFQQALSASAPTSEATTADLEDKSLFAATTAAQPRSAAPRASAIEALLRQEVRSRPTQALQPAKTSAGATR